MFEELLAILPYNPSLIHQLGFYSRRLRAEKAIRRTGLIFIVLAFAVQFFAIMNPSQPTVADSTNDLVNGGFSSAAEAANICRENVNHYGTILHNYGISCSRVASAQTITIHSTDFHRQLYSMGWLPYNIAGETPVNISGHTLYVRYLWGWDTGPPSAYRALNVTTKGGQTFLLLYSCGNLTAVGLPRPVTPPPPPPPPVKPPKPAPAPKPPKPTPKPAPKCQYDTALPASSSKCVPCEYNSKLIASSSGCKSCQASLSSQDTIACIVVHKTAANLTQGLTDANNTTAQPNDIIVYTLYADNTGKASVKDYIFSEELSDVLDYANVHNLYGGKLSANDEVRWPAVTIPAGKTVKERVAVQIKSVIPQTPTSVSDPGHFNLVMTNVYGNAINIKVPGSLTKTIETAAATTLPNTGPGSSLLVGAAIIVVAGYFFARSRLLSKEVGYAIQDNTQGGI